MFRPTACLCRRSRHGESLGKRSIGAETLTRRLLGWLRLSAGGLPAMGLTIMDPTDESEAIERSLAARDASLDNATIALIDM